MPEQEKYYNTETNSIWTFETKIELSPCEYDINAFRGCVKNEMLNGKFEWSLYNNCRDWVRKVVRDCKKKNKRCAKYP